MENEMKNVSFFDSPIKVLGGSILLVEGILTLILTNGKLTEIQQTWIIIGMILTLILTVIASVIMHWIDKPPTSKITKDKDNKKYDYDIFISFPIAGIESKKEREQMNEFANKLEGELRKIGYSRIFNASLHFSKGQEYQPPKIACETDFTALDKSKNFLLIYPEKIATSALIELGYAVGGEKNIIMCSNSPHTLPFLARGLSEAYRNVSFIEYGDENHLSNMLIEHNNRYFRK